MPTTLPRRSKAKSQRTAGPLAVVAVLLAILVLCVATLAEPARLAAVQAPVVHDI